MIKVPLSNHQIDKLIGQTPCLCGDITTWHPSCYKEKTNEEVTKLRTLAYKKIRRKLKDNAIESTNRLIKLVAMKP